MSIHLEFYLSFVIKTPFPKYLNVFYTVRCGIDLLSTFNYTRFFSAIVKNTKVDAVICNMYATK